METPRSPHHRTAQAPASNLGTAGPRGRAQPASGYSLAYSGVVDQAPDLALLERVQIIRDQVEAMRAILAEAQKRALLPAEKRAVVELAKAFAELTDAVRTLLV